MIIPIVIAILVGSGVYLILQRGMLRIILGVSLISYGVNLTILAAGVSSYRGEPLADRTPIAEAADPIPQAFVLTAIVISMASTALMLVLAVLGRDDDTRSSDGSTRSEHSNRLLQTLGRAGWEDPDSIPHDETQINRAKKKADRARKAGVVNVPYGMTSSAEQSPGSQSLNSSQNLNSSHALGSKEDK